MTAPTISVEPIDQHRCAFRTERPLLQGDGPHTFTEPEAADDTPAAQAVFGVEGVCQVAFDTDRVTVVRDADGPSWDDLIPRIQYALGTALRSAAPPTGDPSEAVFDDDAIYDKVTDIFQSQINPIVAQHGGAIDLIDVQDATVVVRMSGGCQGCGMANVTLRQGIEAALRKAIPSLAGVRDVTDHSSGTDPYFASSGK